MASQDWFEKDFYKALGVSPDADDAEIKKAYRKLARANHPDSNPGDEAAEQRFKEVGEAYQVLSDTEDRQQYDAIRQMAGGGARFTSGGGNGGGAGFEDVFSSMFGGGGGSGQRVRFSTGGGPGGPGAGQEDLEDLLRMFGGGGDPFGGASATRGPRRGADRSASVTIDFRSAVEGDTVTFRQPNGSELTARIPAGVKDGQKIRLRGKGDPGEAGAPDGDLMLTVAVRPHPVFSREGNHLTVELPVTFAEAALGATVKVPTLDGSSVRVKVAPGTPSGRRLRVKGRGVSAKSGTGDLLATVQIVVPQRLTPEAREAVEALRASEADVDPRADLIEQASS